MSRLIHSFTTLTAILIALAWMAGCGPAPRAADVTPAAATAWPPRPSPSAAATRVATPRATPGRTPATTAAPDDAVAEQVTELLQRPVPTAQKKPAWPQLSAPDKPGSPKKPTAAAIRMPTVTPTPTEDVLAGAAGVVTADRVNVRGGPGTAYAIVQTLQKSADFSVLGRNESGAWLRICCLPGAQQSDAKSADADGEQTWIAAEFVSMTLPAGKTLADLPPLQAPPAPVAPVAAGSGSHSAADLAAAPAVNLPAAGSFSPPGGVNPLTGQPLAGNGAGQRPLIVCINNDYAARPQLGLSQADVMYEYLMEGYGITRFSAIFYGQPSNQIGPVRSARLINYYMGALYDAGLACSGASDPVRYALKHQAPFPYMDIDLDDGSNTRYSVSIGTDYRTRLRTGTDKLRQWLADWGVDKPAAIRGFTFGATPAGGAPAASIAIPYPRATGSQVAYRYDAGSGRYLRSLGGGAHVDGNSGAQLALDNVIVQFVPHQATDIVEDSLGSTSIRLDLFGSGRAIVFRDGLAFEGTWRSDSRGDTPHFFAAGGAEIPLKPGQSWISVVPADYAVTYQ